MFRSILIFCALVFSSSVLAANNVKLSSDIYVERVGTRSDGKTGVILESPATVVPGDNLVFFVKYENIGSAAASDFSVTNPLPKAVAFNGTPDGTEIVSIDGGKKFGLLSNLTRRLENGELRPALFRDVTHVRWSFDKPLQAGAKGTLIFRGVVK